MTGGKTHWEFVIKSAQRSNGSHKAGKRTRRRVPPYPLILQPAYKDYIWGGDRIIRKYRRKAPPGVYAESWEVSDRREGMSTVANGPLKGKSLREAIKVWGADLLGEGRKEKSFPLLIKLIDARDTLSVQVHPDDASAEKYGGEPKTEMWYALEAAPEACVYAGLQPGVDRKSFRKAVRENKLEELLARVPIKAGEAVFMPGGRVHAIGAGCLLLEVQQNSDTTYRIYDWGRVGKDGKPRELHLDEALRVIRWDDVESPKAVPRRIGHLGKNELWEILSCPWFRLEKLVLNETWEGAADRKTFQVLFAAEGRIAIEWDSAGEKLVPGTTCLLPAALPRWRLKPAGKPATILRVTRP